MAHFAQMDANDNVINVIVVNNATIDDLPFPESEPVGVAFLTQWSGGYTNWKQTSYNTIGGVHSNGGKPFRKNYAAIGYTYDIQRDAFIPIKFYASWSLNEDTCQWQPPVAMPTDGQMYSWDEATTSWKTLG